MTPSNASSLATSGTSVLDALRRSLAAHQPALAHHGLERLRDKGLAHEHVRLAGSGLLARIPKQSQMGLSAQANLDYQAECFRRASAGGHAPRLHAVLPPAAEGDAGGLPRGALLVQDIRGRPATLPHDLGAIVRALAALHALPLPAAGQRAPLLASADPLAALAREIRAQAAHLEAARVAPAVARHIDHALQALYALCAQPARAPVRLVAFDGHPGNFIVRDDGQAVLVDLEKCRYSHPSLDLAHATLYTSTTWDIDSHAVLDTAQVHEAYRAWAEAVHGPHASGLARASLPWHVPLRRAMWLWSVTWCAKWRVLSARDASGRPDGEDWSARHSDDTLVRHVRGRVDHYLSEAVVARVLHECDELDGLLCR